MFACVEPLKYIYSITSTFGFLNVLMIRFEEDWALYRVDILILFCYDVLNNVKLHEKIENNYFKLQ